MTNIIEDAKAEYSRAQARITKDLIATPDDKINWSPTPASRTPIQLVAHAAMGTSGIGDMLAGKPFPFSSMAELDTESRKAEKEFTTREQALGLLEKTSSDYLTWLDTLTPEQVSSTLNLPFGEVPMASAITFAADHLRCHAAQLEYLQTVHGDYAMHG